VTRIELLTGTDVVVKEAAAAVREALILLS
jgi:hypothetical protein